MQNGSAACKIQELKRSFGATHALAGLTLSLFPGDIALLLGSNGAGKSTLLRICAGLTKPDEGNVHFTGAAHTTDHQRKVGYVDHQLLMYEKLTLGEHLKMQAQLMNLDTNLQNFLVCWQLDTLASKVIESLSKGQQARASLCRAFLPNPDYLFFDEPTAALDDAACLLLTGAITQTVQEGGSSAFALIATHDVSRLLSLANRIIVLREGVVAHDSAPDGGTNSSAGSLEDALSLYRELNR